MTPARPRRGAVRLRVAAARARACVSGPPQALMSGHHTAGAGAHPVALEVAEPEHRKVLPVTLVA